MDLNFTPAEQAFREEVRAFLAEHNPSFHGLRAPFAAFAEAVKRFGIS